MSKTHYIENEAGEKICVECFEPKIELESPNMASIVFCHGITGCRKGRTTNDHYLQDLAKDLADDGFKVILFDFSGHGDSEGASRDVCVSKSTGELNRVIEAEAPDKHRINFLAFSYGATVLDEYLAQNKNIQPNKIVLFSPCLFPLESCFLNRDSIFGKDILEAYTNGALQKDGFTVVGAKNFEFGHHMIEECQQRSPKMLQRFAKQILLITGDQDVILDTSYNHAFCLKYNINELRYPASHSLFESIDIVKSESCKFFKS